MADLRAWLDDIGLGRHAELLRSHDIDFDVLRTLTEPDLKELGLSLGDRRRLLQAIASRSIGSTEPASERAGPPPLADRRQLTVVFSDLADSTQLSAVLDPEELREVLRLYQGAVAGAVRAAGGFVAKYLGDGVLAYFGYPQAQEDAAERAVRAGLAAAAAVAALPAAKGEALAARVGIATGPVVVGDVIGEELAREVNVVGETPNLAARLQGVADRGQVVIAETTRRLVGELFALRTLAPQELRGYASPVRAFVVEGARAVESRFAAVRAARSRFVGRAQEVGLLVDRWESAKAGEGQLVLLAGEAGIGKSRISEAFGARIAAEAHLRIRWQCSPQHVNSPLYPVAAQVTHAAGIAADDGDAVKTTKLASVLRTRDADRLALLGTVLGVPLAASSDLAQMAAGLRRQRTLEALVEELAAHSQEQPVLLLLEDAHWIDPTTQDLLGKLVERLPQLAMLTLVTHRPDYAPPWSHEASATRLTLNRLTRTQIVTLLEDLAEGRTLPQPIVEHIVVKSDGIPLYVEEMFAGLRDGGVIEVRDGGYALARSLDGHAVPATLQDALMARLDRHVSAKAVAQIGAVIGREFSHGLLTEVAAIPAAALREGLEELLAAGLVFARGTPPVASYVFKHALVQDAAYGSLLKAPRQAAHGRIAAALAATGTAAPELVAQHFEAAERWHDAVDWYERAGNSGGRYAAPREVLAAYEHAWSLTSRRLTEAEQKKFAGRLLRRVGEIRMQVFGYSSPAALEAYEDACRYALEKGDRSDYLAALTGLGSLLYTSAEVQQLATRLSEITDPDLAACETPTRIRYLGLQGLCRIVFGDLTGGASKLSQAIELDDRDPCGTDHLWGGADPAVALRAHYGPLVGVLGYPQKAMKIGDASVAIARNRDHKFSLAWALQVQFALVRRNADL
ncbi:MAG: adenylate cyclase, partial [Alphaproteobacteria bacterium]|nr:adenylate cyclase [Alphaproteobacteria bacterium]